MIGAGTMGRGIANLLVAAGVAVDVHDPDPAALEAARHALERALDRRGPSAAEKAAALARHRPHAALADAVRDAQLVFEAVPEELDLKLDVIARVTRLAPASAIVATNTSSLDVDFLAEASPHPALVLGCHFFNPPEVVPGVEVVPGRATDPAALHRVVALLEHAGKEPVVVANVSGFIANRLQEAMVAEALRCLDRGLASAADIDRIVRTTFGPRLALWGPLEIVDQVGLEVERRALAHLRDAPGGDVYAVPPVLDDLIAAGRTGLAAGAGVHDYDEDPTAVLEARQDALSAVLSAVPTNRNEETRKRG